MRRLGGIDDFPVVFVKHLALVIGQAALGIVQDQAGAERREGRIDMDRIGITGKVYRMHPVIGVVPTQPLDPLSGWS